MPLPTKPIQTFGACLSLLFLTACTTTPVAPGPERPPELKMNIDAGRIQPIYVMLQVENGGELPFLLDTGAQVTVLDQSLGARLGERLRTTTLWSFDGKHDATVYAAPSLYLGGVRLQKTGTYVNAFDCQPTSAALGRHIMGALGIDVLEHYCIQLDFYARKIRFLDDRHANKKDWGEPFPLIPIEGGGYHLQENLVGTKVTDETTGTVVDTGFLGDGWLTPPLLQQWTNRTAPPAAGQVRAPNGRLGGESYPGLFLDQGGYPFNGIGILFLSRHLVTLDFPNRTLYLKRTTLGHPQMTVKEMKAEGGSAWAMLKQLKQDGRLPGWSKEDEIADNSANFVPRSIVSGSYTFQKLGDPARYHFQVVRPSESEPWKLVKAWRTDKSGRTVEEYPVDTAQ